MITSGKKPEAAPPVVAGLPGVEWKLPSRAQPQVSDDHNTQKVSAANKEESSKSAESTSKQEKKASNPRLVEELKKFLGSVDGKLDFDIHEQTGQMIVRVTNKETNEVVREIPMEEFLDVKANIKESIINFLDILA